MSQLPLCPACGRPTTPGDSVCFHCRAVLDPFTKGARVAGRYVIEENIGQGGMGRVYRAYDEALHEKVAIKTLLPEFSANPSFLARFRDEVRLARRVAHPNVCRVHDYVDHAGTPFLSMEWVDGETLASRLKRLGPRPEAELLTVLDDVTDALHALWSNGIVHRDLKPANLMWTRTERVKVMDFGLARALLGEGMRDKTSGVVGSPEYLSPEQIRGEPATEKSDTYSLGVTLFELASGRPPFRGESPGQTLMKHLSDLPDAAALASISEPLRDTILGSLEKNPALRPELRGASIERIPPEFKAKDNEARTDPWIPALVGLVFVVGVVIYFAQGSSSVPSPLVSPSPSVRGSSPGSFQATPGLSPSTTALTESSATPPESSERPSPSPRPIIATASPTATPSAVPTPAPIVAAPTPVPSLIPEPSPSPATATPSPQTTPTATSTPVVPVTARLLVVVKPWAEVFVNGESKGQTPFSALVLPPGSYVVELRHPLYRPYRRTIELKAGEESRLSVDLQLEGIRK